MPITRQSKQPNHTCMVGNSTNTSNIAINKAWKHEQVVLDQQPHIHKYMDTEHITISQDKSSTIFHGSSS